jgi:hypothetical protein
MDDRFELIDAFVDGERVDAAALKRLLAEDEGRDYFVDAWLLREGVHDELALEPVPSLPARAGRRWPMLAVAASIVSLIVGGLAGYRVGVGRPDADPATVASAPPPATAPASASFPAPPATRAIPVEFTAGSGAPGGD